MSLVHAWLVAFAMTLALEAPVVFAFYRRVEPRIGRLLGLVCFANLATHPAVWFVFPRFGLPYGRQVALSEAWAFGLEIVFYALAFPGRPRRAALAAIAANAVSFAVGWAYLALGGHF